MTEESGWTEARRALVRRTICPKGISEDEFLLFMEQCQRSGLDPLVKQAFCVPRRQNIGDRDRPNWVTKHEFQPSRDGLLVRANQFPDYKGMTSAAVYAEDDITIDAEAGTVKHTFNPAKRKGSLVGAWARVLREGKLPVVMWVDFAAYVQSTPLWGKMPATMIQKVAEAAALRKAYPAEFGGLYIAGERPDDADMEEEPVQATEPATTRPPPPPPSTPALPAPTPRITLERAPERETVPAESPAIINPASTAVPSFADGKAESDDAATTFDPVEAEADAICRDAGAELLTEEERLALCKRAEGLPKGTPGRKRAGDALLKAKRRIAGGAR